MVDTPTPPGGFGIVIPVRFAAAAGCLVGLEGEELQGVREAAFIRARGCPGGVQGGRGLGDGWFRTHGGPFYYLVTEQCCYVTFNKEDPVARWLLSS